MARKAREKSEYGLFYIRQASSPECDLFRQDEDREYFVKLLEESKLHFQFDLIAYCILNKDAYHLVIDLKGSDLSQVMKSLNISYAMHRKAEGKLFKDRYKSLFLNGESELMQVLSTIRHDSVETHWQSFCQVNLEPSSCKDCIRSYEAAEQYLEKACQSMNLSRVELLKDKDTRNKYIIDMRKKSTLSLKEIGELFGGISESSVCKIIKDCH